MLVFGVEGLTHTRPATDKIPEETLEKLRGRHILLVEDNEINQMVAVEILQQMNMLVSVASSGEQAVQMAGLGDFDAILMDINMPGMDGYQATAQIRELVPELALSSPQHSGVGRGAGKLAPNQALNQIPIIAMTAYALDNDSQKALEAGMDDYVSKPVNVVQLASVLLRWLDGPRTIWQNPQYKSVDSPQNPVSADPPALSIPGAAIWPESTPQQEFLPAALDAIDMASALTRLADNKNLYRRLLVMFHSEHAQDVQAIRTALQRNDLELARRLAHNLKGLAGTVGADELNAAAKKLEMAIAEENPQVNESNLAQCEQKLAVVITSIASLL
jgi:CheY-like chemotaxis protein